MLAAVTLRPERIADMLPAVCALAAAIEVDSLIRAFPHLPKPTGF